MQDFFLFLSHGRSILSIKWKDEKANLELVFTNRTIIAMVLLDGALLTNLVLYKVEQRAISLDALGGMLAILAIAFPVHERATAWIEQRLRGLGKRSPSETWFFPLASADVRSAMPHLR